MPLRYEHGAARPQPTRTKDLPPRLTAAEPSRNRDASGRFVTGNDAATARGLKAYFKRTLGKEATAEVTAQLYRDALRLLRAMLRTLPSDAPQVVDRAAASARCSVLAAHLANMASEAGLATDEGRKLLDQSIKLDARAERNAVTATDLAERYVRNKPPEPNPHMARIEAARQAARGDQER